MPNLEEMPPYPDIDRLRAEGDLQGLIAALSYPGDPDVRRRAAWALGWYVEDIHAAVVTPLIAAFNNKEEIPGVRASAAEALGLIDSAQAVALFISALTDEAPEVRVAAASSLGKMNDLRAIEPLVEACKDAYAQVRDEAAWALGQLSTQVEDAAAFDLVLNTLIAALRDADENVRRAAAESMELISAVQSEASLLDRAVEPLIDALSDKSTGVNVGSIAANTLGNLGASTVIPLLAVLDGADVNARENAAWALGFMGGRLSDPTLCRKVIERLINLLRDTNRTVRGAAAYALGEIGCHLEDVALRARTIEPLMAATQDESSFVHRAATRALECIGTPETLSAAKVQQRGKKDRK
ncbi:MAG: HEAT repeat domain-containing protein [Anaerolineae bacterium]|nr:HEAT repeat domain-containing protein [Anaerolineae bacterium]